MPDEGQGKEQVCNRDGTDRFLKFEEACACPVCGSGRIRADGGPQIGICSVCGLIFCKRRPTAAEIERYYSTGRTYDGMRGSVSDRDRLLKLRIDILGRSRAGPRLLDVGTGTGDFLDSARRAGFDPTGTEVSEEGANIASRRGFIVHRGRVEHMGLAAESFDVVTMWHVLEHLPNPVEVLVACRNLLAPGGILLAAVPNVERRLMRCAFGLSPKEALFGEPKWGEEVHLLFFRPRSLQMAVKLAGFEKIGFGVDVVTGDLFYSSATTVAIQRLLGRILGWHFGRAMFVVGRKPMPIPDASVCPAVSPS